MQNIHSFSELHSVDYCLSNIYAENQHWGDGEEFIRKTPRQKDAILMFCNSSGAFFDYEKNKFEEIAPQSLYFIPKDSLYKWKFSNKKREQITTILFSFELSYPNGEPIIFKKKPGIIHISDFNHYKDMFSLLVSEISKPSASSSKIKATAYSIFANLVHEDKKNKILSDSISCIYKGIKYLEENAEQNKTVAEIAAMCNVSTNYFERLFRQYSGQTPASYRIHKKINRARLLLANNNLNIRQISEEIGFDDYAYFCRVFKKVCGCTPTEYRKQNHMILFDDYEGSVQS